MKVDPSYTGAYYIRGLAYEKINQIDQSIEDYTTVLEIDPSHVNAAFARGACENKRGNYMKAIEDYNMALKLDSERDTLIKNKERLNQNLGMSYVVPNSNEGFLSASKIKSRKNNKSVDNSNGLQIKNDNNCDIMSNNGTNSFIEGGDQTPSIFNSTITSIESTPNGKKADVKTEKLANLLQLEINEYKKLKIEADHYHALGFAARKRGTLDDYRQAIKLYTTSLQILPVHFKALFNRGFAFDKIKEYEKAIEDYNQAIELDPNNPFAYYNRGISYDKMGKFEEAIESFSIAIKIDSTKADFYHNRGYAYRKMKMYEEAIEDYTDAVEIGENELKRSDQKEKGISKLVRALHNLATIKEKLGGDHLGSALEFFNKAICYDSKYSPAYNGRGLVWDRLFNFEEAIKDFSQAIYLDQNHAVYWHNRGCCYRNMGLLEDSLNDFDKAVDLDPYNPIIYSNKGLVLRKLERFEEAIEVYSRELELCTETKNKSRILNNRAY
jgi:tetratricopeptide (TPR) repeat protein